jgi:lysophospholipase L1-like esterase
MTRADALWVGVPERGGYKEASSGHRVHESSEGTISMHTVLRRLLSVMMLIASPHVVAAADDMTIRPPRSGERIVFLGDSITQAGDKPGGYVDLVRTAVEASFPNAGVEVIGAGISGNKVPDLEKRLEQDVLAKKASTVVVYIGINDVWHSIRDQGTPKEAFEKGLRSLTDRIRASGARVILCTPSVIGEKSAGNNKLDAMLDEYAGVTRSIAADMKTGLIDLRKAFVEHLAVANAGQAEAGVLTSDGVHLNAKGNQFVAERMLEALGVNRHLRHIVLFKFKESSTATDVERIIAAFRDLPAKIDAIQAFEWGTDISPEGKSQGFTHCFVVTFATEAARDAYLPHPAHREFVSIVGPHVDKVCVVDFWAQAGR